MQLYRLVTATTGLPSSSSSAVASTTGSCAGGSDAVDTSSAGALGRLGNKGHAAGARGRGGGQMVHPQLVQQQVERALGPNSVWMTMMSHINNNGTHINWHT